MVIPPSWCVIDVDIKELRPKSRKQQRTVGLRIWPHRPDGSEAYRIEERGYHAWAMVDRNLPMLYGGSVHRGVRAGPCGDKAVPFQAARTGGRERGGRGGGAVRAGGSMDRGCRVDRSDADGRSTVSSDAVTYATEEDGRGAAGQVSFARGPRGDRHVARLDR